MRLLTHHTAGLAILIPATVLAMLGTEVAVAQSGSRAGTSSPAPVVDEPLGARYSLGLTLWHLGHSPEMIRRFHQYVRQAGLTPASPQTPEKLLAAGQLSRPVTVQRVLLEPELLSAEQLNGWRVDGGFVVSAATDAGPTMSLPLHVPQGGTYRLWVRFLGRPGARAVTFLKIYRAGREQLGPICQPDEIYAEPPDQAGPAWKDLIVDLPGGDYTVRLGHVTRWWHGPGAYDERRIDCLYLTNELWAEPPSPEQLKAIREKGTPQGPQWTAALPLPATDREAWRWWQVRPLSWEEAAAHPKLFALGRKFWQQTIEELARKDCPAGPQGSGPTKEGLPDYRAPERQVVFNETWNMVANPVRARRQIETLQADVGGHQNRLDARSAAERS